MDIRIVAAGIAGVLLAPILIPMTKILLFLIGFIVCVFAVLSWNVSDD